MASALKDFFKPFLEKKDPSVLGIDIGSASIKVVQAKIQKGKAILETYGELALGPYAGVEVGRATRLSTEKVVEAVKDVLKEANTSTVSAALSIPMRASMVSVITIPASMDQKQMPKMIPIEARKYIPVPISEVTLDWFVIPKVKRDEDEGEENPANKDTQEVLVVAIHNDVLTKYSTIVQEAGLKANFFEVEMFSSVRSVLGPGDNTPVLICDMGAAATKVYIVQRGIVRDSHIINKGSQDITLNISKALDVDVLFAEKLKRNFGKNKAEQDEKIQEIIDLVVSPIFSDTNTVLLNYQRKDNRTVSKAILMGGGAMLSGLVEKAQTQLAIPVYGGDPFSKLQAPAFLQDVLKKTGFAFATAIGLAIRELGEMD